MLAYHTAGTPEQDRGPDIVEARVATGAAVGAAMLEKILPYDNENAVIYPFVSGKVCAMGGRFSGFAA
jgi:hypothetical protein